MKKIKIVCIVIILLGVGLFVGTFLLIPSSQPVYQWCIGLSSALIILGFGYLVNVLILLSEKAEGKNHRSSAAEPQFAAARHKSGYLVCKIMNIILCIYLLILKELQVEPFVLILSIILLLLQFLLDLLLQLFFLSRKGE